MRVTVGDSVTLVSPRGAVTPFGTAPRVKPYKVAAIFEMGMSEYDRTMIFMPLREAQRYFNKGNSVDVLEVLVDDPERVKEQVDTMKEAGIPSLHFADWRQRNESFFTVLEVERNMMFIILSVIVRGGGLQHHLGPHHAGEGQGPRDRHPAHHGCQQGRHHARVPDHGGEHRRGRHPGGLRRSASLFCLKIDEVRQFVAWLTNTNLFNPEIYYLTRLPADINIAHHRGHRAHGAGAVGAGDALSVLARLAPRSRRSAALRVRLVTTRNRPVQDATARPVLQLQALTRTFRQGDREIPVLQRRLGRALSGPGGGAGRARPVPASRRCCISPACSRRRTAGG